MIHKCRCCVSPGNDFAGRPSLFRVRYGFHYADDLIFGTYTPKWLQMKRLLTTNLRRFGSTFAASERIVAKETQCLLEEIEKQNGDAFDPSLIMVTSVVNALSASVRLNYYSRPVAVPATGGGGGAGKVECQNQSKMYMLGTKGFLLLCRKLWRKFLKNMSLI